MVFVTASVSSVSHAPPASEVDFSRAASAAALLVLLGAVGAAESDIIMFAVKPQQMPSVMEKIQPNVGDSLCLSIAAGVTLDAMSNGLQTERVVRAMPNTPAMVGHGMTAWACKDDVTEVQREQSQLILGAFGEEMFVEDEQYLERERRTIANARERR